MVGFIHAAGGMHTVCACADVATNKYSSAHAGSVMLRQMRRVAGMSSMADVPRR
jgi:hypothetical protein